MDPHWGHIVMWSGGVYTLVYNNCPLHFIYVLLFSGLFEWDQACSNLMIHSKFSAFWDVITIYTKSQLCFRKLTF